MQLTEGGLVQHSEEEELIVSSAESEITIVRCAAQDSCPSAHVEALETHVCAAGDESSSSVPPLLTAQTTLLERLAAAKLEEGTRRRASLLALARSPLLPTQT